MNTFYTAFQVLKDYIEKQGYTIANFSLMENAPDRVVIWVSDNAKGITHFVCVKMGCTQFLIWGYSNDYSQVIATGFDYADVNTPPLAKID